MPVIHVRVSQFLVPRLFTPGAHVEVVEGLPDDAVFVRARYASKDFDLTLDFYTASDQYTEGQTCHVTYRAIDRAKESTP